MPVSCYRQLTVKKEIDMKRSKQDEAGDPKQIAGDGIDRRNFLQCMAWAGTGLVWSMVAGVPTSKLLADTNGSSPAKAGKVEGFSFVQISDSHIGFNKAANQNVTGTLQKTIEKINTPGMKQPDFMIHTGDITQNSKP